MHMRRAAELVVEDGFDVVAVRVEDICRVVADAIVQAQARRSVVRSSRMDSTAVESVDGDTIARSEYVVGRLPLLTYRNSSMPWPYCCSQP